MPKIPASKVLVRRRYLVDCEVCQEAVEPESGAFGTRQEAQEAKARHLEAHAGVIEADDRYIEEINPYLRYRG
jgi:hypothetical protein